MSRRSVHLLARPRAVVLVCLLVLVWCQFVAAAHAASLAMTNADGQVAAQMASMPGCNVSADGDHQSKSPCPSSEAVPDWSKLPVLHALPLPHDFVLAPAIERGFAGPVHWGLPRGRAPPLAQLCRWLI